MRLKISNMSKSYILKYPIIILVIIVIQYCKIAENKENHINTFYLKSTVETNYISKLSDEFVLQDIIPLETKGKSLIGQVSKLVVLNNRIIIIDKVSAEKVMVFDINGNFLFDSGSKGKGPFELLKPGDFCIVNNSLFVLGMQLGKIIEYSLANGEPLNEYKLNFYAFSMENIDDSQFVFLNAMTYGVTKTNDKFKEIYTTKYNRTLNYVLPENPLIKSSKGVFLHNYFSDSLFLIGNQGIKVHYFFDFGDKGLKNNDFIGIKDAQELEKKAIDNKKVIFPNNIILGDAYTYLTFNDFSLGYNFVYYLKDNLTKEELYLSSVVTKDDLTHNKIPPVFSYINNNLFYFVKSPDEIEKLLKDKDFDWNQNDNPIILTFKKI